MARSTPQAARAREAARKRRTLDRRVQIAIVWLNSQCALSTAGYRSLADRFGVPVGVVHADVRLLVEAVHALASRATDGMAKRALRRRITP